MCNYLKLKINNCALQGMNEVLTLFIVKAEYGQRSLLGRALKIESESFVSKSLIFGILKQIKKI